MSVNAGEWDDKSVEQMDAMSESVRWNTIAMYLELPDDNAEAWPQKVVGRLFRIWQDSGWLAARDEMMRITTYSPDDIRAKTVPTGQIFTDLG